MANIYPSLENISRLKVPPTEGELCLANYLVKNLDENYEIFFNPYLDGDRPDFIVLKKGCAAFVIEVKDWSLSNFTVNSKNEWHVNDGRKESFIASPQSQAFKYKRNIYDLHLPVIGLKRLSNPFFYNLVHCFVYFHMASKQDINRLYSLPESSIKEELKLLNAKHKASEIEFSRYNSGIQYFDRKLNATLRDNRMSFGGDQLELLASKMKKVTRHVLFDDDVYYDFHRRFMPSENTLNQGIEISFDKKQLPLTISCCGKMKIKGVAGCGKTSIMAKRAINAKGSDESPVLILTFNITLKNYIKDKISDIQGGRNFGSIEISNYHQFFNSQINNCGLLIDEFIGKYGLHGLYSVDIFKDCNTVKFKTILLDEVQDYDPIWVKIIRDNFLEQDGEMVLFGDESQDIYKRKSGRSEVIAQGFGTWVILNRSYRTKFDSPLNQIFMKFQVDYLLNRNTDIDIFEASQIGINYNILKYDLICNDDWENQAFNLINSYIKAYDLHPNDVVILLSKTSSVRALDNCWIGHEKTHSMLETFDELAVCVGIQPSKLLALKASALDKLVKDNIEAIEKVRRIKKSHFYSNSGLIKLSTIHSFKGLESKSVFYIMHSDDEPEVIYTSITRSSENLIVLDIGGKNNCSDFFRKVLN